jgi:hypothetical protein
MLILDRLDRAIGWSPGNEPSTSSGDDVDEPPMMSVIENR